MTKTETLDEYLTYVQDELKSVDKGLAKASYDTGYGLHIVDAYLGEQCSAVDAKLHSVLQIRAPNIDGEDWYKAWDTAIKMVHELIDGKL